MIKYAELVNYIKKNHVDWDSDLFDVLKGFFNQYYPQHPPSPSHPSQQELNWKVPEVPTAKKFKKPVGGEYTSEDLLDLLST